MPSLFVCLATALVAGAAPALGAAPRLATLEIEIWPEYDRPQALVILKGELAADATMPAEIALRIPAAAGAPSAVAYADASGKLLNLGYQKQDAGPFVLVRLTTPARSFHLEFYDRLASGSAEREYRYAWPGDLAVERVGVLLKEPAAASNLSVSPDLAVAGASPDGLKYRAGEFGTLKAGQPFPIVVRYTKTDSRSSTEILSATPAPKAPAPGTPDGWWLAALGSAGLAIAGGALLWMALRRRA